MEELIAKKYIKALGEGADLESMQNMASLFTTLSDAFGESKFRTVMMSPNVATSDKESILLDALKGVESQTINNFIKLIVENKRIDIIPAIATELQKRVAQMSKTYEGVVYSNDTIADSVLSQLSEGLSKRFDATISLKAVKSDFNGIKVGVESLGVEINFSKDRIDGQMIDHIIKAI